MNHIDETTYELDMLLELATSEEALGWLHPDDSGMYSWEDGE